MKVTKTIEGTKSMIRQEEKVSRKQRERERKAEGRLTTGNGFSSTLLVSMVLRSASC